MEPTDPIQQILERNKRVEADKAWEVSWTRRLIIMGMTYVTASIFLWLIHNELFYLNAIVPVVGYLFSTLSLPWVRGWWVGRQQK